MKSLLFVVLTFALLCINENQASSLLTIDRIGIVYHSCSVDRINNSVLTDNIIDPSSFEVMNIDCRLPELVRFNVKFPPVKNIGSVTVYSGECDDCDGLLDNFLVKLFSDVDSTSDGIKLCGQYNREFLEPGNPMRVNCDVYSNYEEPMIMVGIFPNDYQKTVSKKSAISEITIRLLEYSRNLAFYGCYEEFDGDIVTLKGSCKTTCALLGYRFMALSYDNECKCGSKIPKGLTYVTLCNNPCKEPHIICSTQGTYAVYLARAPHIFSYGCYSVPTSGYAVHSSNMTSSYCIRVCSKKNYVFINLSLDTCYCTTEVTEVKKEAHLCNITCPGDDARCGGNGLVSVYRGCTDNSDQSPCTAVYNCENNNINQFGKCLGPCKVDWTGQYCLTLDIPKPPPVNKRMPMSFKPTRSPISGLSLECRQAVKAFFVQQSEDSKDHSKCIKAVEGRRKPKRGITVQNVVIVIFFSTIIASASGVASGLWYGRSYTVAEMKKLAED